MERMQCQGTRIPYVIFCDTINVCTMHMHIAPVISLRTYTYEGPISAKHNHCQMYLFITH